MPFKLMTLALIESVSLAWKPNSYSPVGIIQLQNHSSTSTSQQEWTDSTEIESVTDSVLQHRLSHLPRYGRYSHAHHGDDAHDQDPTGDFVYPAEHGHDSFFDHFDRVPVKVTQARKSYTVTPASYTGSYYNEQEAVEELPVSTGSYLFPTRYASNLHSARHE